MKKIKFELLKIAQFLKKATTYQDIHSYFINLIPQLEQDFGVQLNIMRDSEKELKVELSYSINSRINRFSIHLLDVRKTREQLDKFHQQMKPLYQKKDSPEKYKEHIENIYTTKVTISIYISWEEEDLKLMNQSDQLRNQIKRTFPKSQYSRDILNNTHLTLQGSIDVS